MRTRLFLFLLIVSLGFGCRKQDVVGNKDYKTLGSSAHDLLSASAYTSLVVQFDYVQGYEPDATTISNLQSFLSSRLNKPDGIQFTMKQMPSTGKSKVAIEDVVNLEKQNRSEFTIGSREAIHILIVDANYTTDNVIGISYWNTSICLFGPMIASHSGGIGQVSRPRLLSAVTEHEFGHLLGLVDQGTPMQSDHKDAGHGAHCTNTSCLMYYGLESNSNFSSLINGLPALDANCINDLRANGGK
ncbi:MAG: hypothetical protein ACM3VS_17895 [Candidatus Dadabacteria bacterium]